MRSFVPCELELEFAVVAHKLGLARKKLRYLIYLPDPLLCCMESLSGGVCIAFTSVHVKNQRADSNQKTQVIESF